jgi:Tol biopolymer transport system component
MKNFRGTVVIAASAALIAAGVLAGAGSAGTSGVGAGNLAFSGIDPSDGMADIYVAKSDGTAKTNITDDKVVHKDQSPAFSPEGRRIAFARQSGAGSSSIMLVNADGSGLVSLTPPAVTPTRNVDPSWAPDGKRIVFASNRDGNFDLYWLRPGSSRVYRLTKTSAPVQNLDPSFSPSGTAIVFSRSGDRATTAAELFRLELATLRASRLTKTLKGLGDRGPVYSPSGTEIAFYSDRAGLDNDDVYVLRLGGDTVERVTTWEKADREPTYAPDGSALAFVSTRSGATELWAQSVVGLAPLTTKPVQLTSDGQFKSHPSWGRAPLAPVPAAS